MDNEMIERVATAITERRTGRDYNSIELAIAAIKAMREPSYEMLANFDGLMINDYQAMIDAITGDK